MSEREAGAFCTRLVEDGQPNWMRECGRPAVWVLPEPWEFPVPRCDAHVESRDQWQRIKAAS